MKRTDPRADRKGRRIPENHCPACGHRLDSATAIEPDRSQRARPGPGPGDFTVCAYCGQACLFREDMTIRAATAEELAQRLDPEGRQQIERAKALIASRRMNHPYSRQLEIMLERKRRWIKDHPQHDIKVQFNFPSSVFVIAPISLALQDHVISANDSGAALIRAIAGSSLGTTEEPTAAMVRAVLEHD